MQYTPHKVVSSKPLTTSHPRHTVKIVNPKVAPVQKPKGRKPIAQKYSNGEVSLPGIVISVPIAIGVLAFEIVVFCAKGFLRMVSGGPSYPEGPLSSEKGAKNVFYGGNHVHHHHYYNEK